MLMQETNEETSIVDLTDSLQKLSFDQLLKELGKMKLKLGIILPAIFEKGKEMGFSAIEIRDKIKKTIDIPERTINPYLPEIAKKHRYPKNRRLANSANYNQNTERSISKNDHMKSLKTIGYVYRNWTLDEFISKYEIMESEYEIMETEIEIMSRDLAEAISRIEELEVALAQEGIVIDV
jgi:hypothetical protein